MIGGGPAGLMAADVLAQAGVSVDVYDAMPSLGRKFLRAGIGGLNLTHSEPADRFASRYAVRQSALAPMLQQFGSAAVCTWAQSLGIETFVGTSGRIFPKEMKAAPLLRAWLRRLRERGVIVHVRHRWQGWHGTRLVFATPAGEIAVDAEATVLALSLALEEALAGEAERPRLPLEGPIGTLRAFDDADDDDDDDGARDGTSGL